MELGQCAHVNLRPHANHVLRIRPPNMLIKDHMINRDPRVLSNRREVRKNSSETNKRAARLLESPEYLSDRIHF